MNPFEEEESTQLPSDLDLDEVRDEFSISEGTHLAELIDFVEDESKKGDPMWVWEWQIRGGDDDGKTIKCWTVLTQKALFRVKQVVEAIQIWSPGKKLKFTRRDIVGRKAMISVVNQEYQGKLRPSIESFGIAPSDSAILPSNEDDDIPF